MASTGLPTPAAAHCFLTTRAAAVPPRPDPRPTSSLNEFSGHIFFPLLQFCFRFLANENSMNWTLESPNHSCTSSHHIIFATGDEVAEGQVAHSPHQSQVWMSQECCWCQAVCARGLGGPHVPTSPAGVWHMKDARPFCRHPPPPRHRGSRVLSFQGTSRCCEGREGLGPALASGVSTRHLLLHHGLGVGAS